MMESQLNKKCCLTWVTVCMSRSIVSSPSHQNIGNEASYPSLGPICTALSFRCTTYILYMSATTIQQYNIRYSECIGPQGHTCIHPFLGTRARTLFPNGSKLRVAISSLWHGNDESRFHRNYATFVRPLESGKLSLKLTQSLDRPFSARFASSDIHGFRLFFCQEMKRAALV